jgi:DNA-binding MurR/RpiR family transcriptional regulator
MRKRIMRIRDTLTRADLDLTPSEAKIAQVLLAEYPTSGLGTATALARRAGVSDPTVVRFISKIGFSGYDAFQAKLIAEVDAGFRSPLLMMEAKRPASKGRSVTETYMHSVAAAIDAAAGATLPQLYDRAVETIMGARGRVLVLGGRFSRLVSGMLASYLTQFRPNIVSLGALSAESFDTLLDLSERDALIVFDYRRYQLDVISFARQSADRGVSLILFTDPYLSPIAAKAKVVIVGKTEVDSPYDSLAPPVAQAEALVAHIVAKQRRGNRSRVFRLEQIRAQNAVTLDRSKSDGSHRAKRRREEGKLN